jgi:hypothetical protein
MEIRIEIRKGGWTVQTEIRDVEDDSVVKAAKAVRDVFMQDGVPESLNGLHPFFRESE